MKSAAWQFGPFLLEPSEHTLTRDGAPVRLAGKDYELLVALIERAGQLVRKEELLQRLWPNAFVEEGNLTKHVSMLRKALGDVGDAGRIIETIPKVGFRFVLPVTTVDQSGPVIPARPAMPRWYAAIAALLALGGISTAILRPWNRASVPVRHEWKALAVLPFTALEEPAASAGHLGIGLTDGIITRLSAQRLLAVRPTSVVRLYAAEYSSDVRSVGERLGVDVFLEGHIQRAADTIRVTVQLSDVERGAPIWGETFDEPSAELFRLEDAIADRVAAALRLQIGAAEQQRLRRRYTENAAAYEEYLAGRDGLLRYTPEGTRLAVAAFERALAVDPSYALARAGLATASADMYLRFAPTSEFQQWGDRATREAGAALALDPDLAEAHAARAAVLRKRDFDWEAAISESRRALTLNPNLDQPHLVQAAAFYHLGLMEQAQAELGSARRVGTADRVEPLRVEGLIALFSSDFTTARQRLEEVSHQSSRAIGDTYLALAYFYAGDRDRARRMLETLAMDPSASTAARSSAALAGILAASHDAAGARRVLTGVLKGGYRDHHVAYSIAAAYAQLGDARKAVQWLRASADTGFPCETWYVRDPLLEPLRRQAGFVQLMAELTTRQASASARYRELR
jgi:DNA-binding winged helix-turn-helix (wHTH) protein/TolB-like protein